MAKFNYADPSPDPSPVKRKRRKISSLATKSISARKSTRTNVQEKQRATPQVANKTGTRVSPREKKNINYTEARSSTTVESIDLKSATAKAPRAKSGSRKAKTTAKVAKKVVEEAEDTTNETKKPTGRKTKNKPARKPAKDSTSVSEDTSSQIEEVVKPKKVIKKKVLTATKKTKSESTKEKPTRKPARKKTKAKEPESSFELSKSDIESNQSPTKINEPVSKAKRPRKQTIEEASRDAPSPLPLPKVSKKKPSPTITKKGTLLLYVLSSFLFG